MNILLIPLSKLFGIITTLRNLLFNLGIFKSHTFKIPIICIGNLSAGGTGKTPHTDYITNLLKSEYKVAIISRGYKRKNYDFKYVRINDSVSDVGDESIMLKRKNPNCVVAVCGDRVKAIRKIIKEHKNIGLIILDDGFQHRWVKAGMNILLTTANNPFYIDNLLPYGNLRESIKESKRADKIIITNNLDFSNVKEANKIRENIAKYSKEKCYFTSIDYLNYKNIFNNDQIKDISEYHIVLVSGIANTDALTTHLKKNTTIVKHFKFKDHHNFSNEDIDDILLYYNSSRKIKRLILTTEKDSIRLLKFEQKFSNTLVYYLPIRIKFQNQLSFDKELKEYVRKNKRNS
jgi:tetraacyldisaccharide 4'-kinase